MRFLITAFGFLLLTLSAPAAVIYSGVQNVAIPFNFDGVFVNLLTKATATTEPGTWTTGAWINPIFGGTQMASNEIVRPSVIAGTAGSEQMINFTLGAVIDGTDFYAASYNGSTTHTGPTLSQFIVGTEGYFGIKLSQGANTHYGWARMTVNDSGSGTLHDWAYNATAGEGLYAGTQLAVPEPSRAVLLAAGLLGLVMRRRRPSLGTCHQSVG